MKKIFLLASSALLLLAGCAKEQTEAVLSDDAVTFCLATEDATSTKAVQDGDGAAAKINHWVMEVRDSDGEVYARKDESGTAGEKTHSFTVKLIKGQTYNILFWTDTKDSYNTSDLTNVTQAAGYVANKDSRDAFSAVVSNFTYTGPSSQNVTLYRPFGQLNIIFTDLADLYTEMGSQTEYMKYEPCSLKVTAKIPTSFNVNTQTAGDAATTALELTADSDYMGNYSTHRAEETIFMDYFFATAGSKDVIDLGFSFYSNGIETSHTFSAVPFQRNYRTNIKGAMMTSGATWNVTVDPVWESGATGADDIIYEVVKDIAGANTVIASEIASGKTDISVKFTEQPNDAGVPGATTGNAILTTNLPEDGKLNILVESQTKELYIGDYVSQTSTDVQTSGTNAAVVNVNIPANSGILKLVVNAPSKTVYVNGIEVDSGEITDLDAITSYNTLIIAKDQTVTNLKIRQGALEIHGTVGTASVEVAEGEHVYVRDCEGLSQSVYDVLKPYIDVDNGYAGVQNGETWDIVKGAADPVAKIGDTKYYTVAAALSAAQTMETIVLQKNYESVPLTIDKAVTLDLNGKTLGGNVTIANGSSAIINGTLANNLAITDDYTITTEAQPLTVNGKLTSTEAITIQAGTFKTAITENDLAAESCIYGGTFYGAAPYSGYIAEGYIAQAQGTDPESWKVTAPVAKTQTGYSTWNYYGDLGSALTYLNDNTGYNSYKTVLLTDTETGASYTSENPMYVVKTKSSKTLDLDGKTLTVTNPSSLVLNGYNYLIGNGGTIKAANEGDVALVVKDAPSGKTGYGIPTNITIDGAVVYDNSYQIISDGTEIKGDVSLTNNSNIFIYGGTFGGALSADSGSAFTITAGTFSQDPSAYVSLPYVATKTGDVWVVAEKQYDYVAQIGENKYTTLAAAFSAVTANQTIQLIGCTTITSGITVSKTCTLDLNGFVISDNTSKLFTTSGSITFTITDNSANHDGKITTTASTPSSCEFVHMEFSSPKLVINNGVFVMYAGSGIMFNCQGTGAKCDINGGHFISGGTGTIVVHYYQNTSYNNQITGGTFEAVSVTGSQAKLIDMGGASGSNYITVTISGGTFSESGTQTEIFNGFKMSKVIIKKVEGRDEPEFSCTNKIFNGVLTVDISAGKFTGSGSFFSSSSGTNTAHSVISGGTFHYTNANKWASSGIFNLNCTEQYFDITGGTFTSDVIYKIFYLHAPSNKKVISVTGGTFTENPAETYRNYYNSKTGPFNLVASGYVSAPNGTSPETWTVTEDVK